MNLDLYSRRGFRTGKKRTHTPSFFKQWGDLRADIDSSIKEEKEAYISRLRKEVYGGKFLHPLNYCIVGGDKLEAYKNENELEVTLENVSSLREFRDFLGNYVQESQEKSKTYFSFAEFMNSVYLETDIPFYLQKADKLKHMAKSGKLEISEDFGGDFLDEIDLYFFGYVYHYLSDEQREVLVKYVLPSVVYSFMPEILGEFRKIYSCFKDIVLDKSVMDCDAEKQDVLENASHLKHNILEFLDSRYLRKEGYVAFFEAIEQHGQLQTKEERNNKINNAYSELFIDFIKNKDWIYQDYMLKRELFLSSLGGVEDLSEVSDIFDEVSFIADTYRKIVDKREENETISGLISDLEKDIRTKEEESEEIERLFDFEASERIGSLDGQLNDIYAEFKVRGINNKRVDAIHSFANTYDLRDFYDLRTQIRKLNGKKSISGSEHYTTVRKFVEKAESDEAGIIKGAINEVINKTGSLNTLNHQLELVKKETSQEYRVKQDTIHELNKSIRDIETKIVKKRKMLLRPALKKDISKAKRMLKSAGVSEVIFPLEGENYVLKDSEIEAAILEF